MKILFIHQNFPGQFKAIAAHLARERAFQVLAIGKEGCPAAVPGVKTVTYKLHRAPVAATHHYVKPFEAAVLHGQAALRVLLALKAQGFTPDVVVAHPGWGETLFLRDAFPLAKLIHFCEYYYHASGADVGFDPEFARTLDDAARIRAKNALPLLNLENCDLAVAPTQWQKSLHPSAYQDKIRVVHEGIDTGHMRPDAQARLSLPDGTLLKPGDQVVTFVARNLEPYRGFHVFMRALPRILAKNPGCTVVIVGGDDVSYGAKPKAAANWREQLMREIAVDTRRVHFLGTIAHAKYRALLQVSAAHVYLTYPFVLSWSMLEAMACGCAVIGSRTAPVTEVITDGENGLLVDFFDGDAIADKIHGILSGAIAASRIRALAVESVARRFPLDAALAGYRAMILGSPRQDAQARPGAPPTPDNQQLAAPSDWRAD
ncbi:glycosyltransferase family 4 protein [Massilia glaciei]|uniref:glycosyltransferase family 4 protein n=1 Tax=Massilia glaciei TaxID=1524097 RepID=UPI001E39E147|nr:glycosyltransferase family 4 protein [Massilia glaciei]